VCTGIFVKTFNSKVFKKLPMNVTLDTGQYNFTSSGSKLGFLKSGLTTACF